jgi:hypothetical protein
MEAQFGWRVRLVWLVLLLEHALRKEGFCGPVVSNEYQPTSERIVSATATSVGTSPRDPSALVAVRRRWRSCEPGLFGASVIPTARIRWTGTVRRSRRRRRKRRRPPRCPSVPSANNIPRKNPCSAYPPRKYRTETFRRRPTDVADSPTSKSDRTFGVPSGTPQTRTPPS